MTEEIRRLIDQLHALEDNVERRLDEYRDRFRYRLHKGRATFDADVRAEHRRLRVGVLALIRATPLRTIAVAPVIYAMIVPLVLLDLSISAYQQICFRAWGIARVIRSQHVVVDRHRLPYLNAIQKLNCAYCGYGNGVIAFAREVLSRTEQYWCPIKHAIQLRRPHDRYPGFVDYGDAEGYRTKLEEFRRRLR